MRAIRSENLCGRNVFSSASAGEVTVQGDK